MRKSFSNCCAILKFILIVETKWKDDRMKRKIYKGEKEGAGVVEQEAGCFAMS